MIGSISYLLFSIGSYRFAIDSAFVEEITRVVALDPLPGSSSIVKGIFNLRGCTVLCVDVSSVLPSSQKPFGVEGRIIVIEQDGKHTGLLVHDVVGIKSLAIDETDVPSNISAVENAHCIRRVLRTEEGFVFELHPDVYNHPEKIGDARKMTEELLHNISVGDQTPV